LAAGPTIFLSEAPSAQPGPASTPAEFLQRAIGETVEVEVVGTAGSWQIEADPNHLETALLNLVINSRDAMPDGGKITIEVTNIFADEVLSTESRVIAGPIRLNLRER
jgi:signal transduction histidine kinase